MEQATTETTERNSAYRRVETKDITAGEPPKILWNKDQYYRLADLGILTTDDQVSPLAAPDAKVKVADILP